MRKVTLLFITLLLAILVAPVSAQSGYTNGDRVFGICHPTLVEIYGITPEETGVQLTVFHFSTLFAQGAGQVSAQTGLGQVVLSYDLQGNFRVFWIGGPYFATGSNDFTKAFNCTMPVYIAPPVPIVVPPPSMTSPPPVTLPQLCASGSHYVVRRGDTLFRISRRCGVTVDALVHLNHIPNRNLIYVGQVLVIP